ncbi:hypothetical protein WICPIJ_004102 [Wickerhamomyces pijperi]|uniref:Cell division control protein 24 n=1 Tax=Wickerhamomyces pijperi TaxID=599730 RepID=A0A9P8TN89_WICPI|nr:hypothetical protein WICPIJ_004102 [Wickerhamomyces pijperi]
MAAFSDASGGGTLSNNISLKSISTSNLLNTSTNSSLNINTSLRNNSTANILSIPSPIGYNPSSSTLSVPTMNSSNANTLMLMNRQVTNEDSLFYICLKLKRRLETVPQLKPYLNLSYSSAEVLSENQALSLSQYKNSSSSSINRHTSMSLRSSDSNNFRTSAYSNFSNMSEETSSSQIVPLNTFHAGVLPANVNCDPVTQLWALFQQGSPLCVIFNLIKPSQALPVISSDDIKICKKSIYSFILACTEHLNFDNSDLFTISNVFSDNTEDFIRIVNVVNKTIDLAPHIFKNIGIDDEIKADDSKSKVLREIVETERKYVADLEVLSKYKDQLLDNNLVNSDDVYMLFPNLDAIIDFQRRVLISFEINSLSDPKYQRVGSIFIHAQAFFKLYIPWSVGQKSAIDFITSSPLQHSNTNLVIENSFELQSFLLKPVQRLCKYPLLLKELIKHTDPSSPNYNELMASLDIAKKIANDINENQRRVENIEVLKKLYDKVVDWKGYNVQSFGELLFYDKVSVKDNSKVSEEREFQIYLFENIIIFFKEIVPQQKKPSITALKKRSQTNLLNQEVLGLELKGRISIANIYNISSATPYQLNISWSGMKDTGCFLMKFKNDEVRSNWEQCIRKLVVNLQEDYNQRNSNGDTLVGGMSNLNMDGDRRSNGFSMAATSNRSSYVGNGSRIASDSTTATSSTSSVHQDKSLLHSRRKSEIQTPQSRRATQEFQGKRSFSESVRASTSSNSIMVKLMYKKDLFTMMTALDIPVQEFVSKVERKITQCGGVMNSKIKYQDEDGDLIVIQSEEDWNLAKDMMKESTEKVLYVWVA